MVVFSLFFRSCPDQVTVAILSPLYQTRIFSILVQAMYFSEDLTQVFQWCLLHLSQSTAIANITLEPEMTGSTGPVCLFRTRARARSKCFYFSWSEQGLRWWHSAWALSLSDVKSLIGNIQLSICWSWYFFIFVKASAIPDKISSSMCVLQLLESKVPMQTERSLISAHFFLFHNGSVFLVLFCFVMLGFDVFLLLSLLSIVICVFFIILLRFVMSYKILLLRLAC